MNAIMGGEKTILLVEDSDEDYAATRRAVKKTGASLRLERVENAAQALDYLLQHGVYINRAPRPPSLILLDLNLPGTDGREFLVRLKNDLKLREIPVVILTSSENPHDILYCYKNGANGYQLKPINFEKYLISIKSMIDYWLETATLPSAIN